MTSKVGVGVYDPEAILHILDLESGPTQGSSIKIFPKQGPVADFGYDGGSDSLFWFTHYGEEKGETRFRWQKGPSSRDLLVIKNDGRIGIGIAEPSAKLHIEAGSLFIDGENAGVIVDAGWKRVGFMKYPTKEGGIWRVSGQDFEIGRVDVTDLSLNPNHFDTDLYIAGNGNVGIGTLNPPTEKLEVMGTVKATAFKGDGSGLAGVVTKSGPNVMVGPLVIENSMSITENGSFGGTLLVREGVGVRTRGYPTARLHIYDEGYGNIKLFSQSGVLGDFTYDGGSDNTFWFTHYGAESGTTAFRWNNGSSSKDLLVIKNEGFGSVTINGSLLLVNEECESFIALGPIGMAPGSVIHCDFIVCEKDIHFSGNLIGGGKGRYVMDQFINAYGEALEQGDVVVISKNQSSLYYIPDHNVPVPEVDIAQAANDTRVCGIACKIYTEPPQGIGEIPDSTAMSKNPEKTKPTQQKERVGSV